MEITSFGLASKAATELKRIKDDMGSNVKRSYGNVKERLDQVEKDIEQAYKLTNDIIVNNAINISKAEAKINAYAKALRESMEQMIFDDLYDLSGIEISMSSGYSYNATSGYVQYGTVVTKEIYTGGAEVLLLDCTPIYKVFYSTDNTNWKEITNNKLVYLTESEKTANSLRLKFQMSGSQYVDYYSIMWA